VDSPCLYFFVLVDVLSVFHYHGDRFELIGCLEQDLFPIIVVFFIFFYSITKNVFSFYVLFLSVKLKDNLICFLNDPIA